MGALLRWLQTLLPKPLLFGLYGAVGCILGGLALGEPLWALLVPPPPQKVTPPPPPPELRISASSEVVLDQGSKNKFNVRIARDHFEGPVTIDCTGLPSGVRAHEVTIEQGSDQGVVELEAAADAVVGSKDFKATGSGVDKSKKTVFGGTEARLVSKDAPVRLTVNQRPLPQPELRISASSEVVVEQGGKNKFGVRIARDHFSGPVNIRCVNLPSGVRCNDVTISSASDYCDLQLEAAADAMLGTSDIKVQGKSEVSGEGSIGGNGATTGSAKTTGKDTVAGKGTGTSNLSAAMAGPRTLLSKEAPVRLTVRRTSVISPEVDILFVLDVTGSMQSAINGVRDGIREFAGELSKRQLNARVGVLAFRDRLIHEEPKLLSFKGDTFTNDYDAFRDEVDKLRASGGGDAPESSLDAIALATRQPFRPKATKVILLITDAPPHVPDKEVESIGEVVSRLKDAKVNQLHLVTKEDDRATYEELQRGADGQYFDLASAARGAGGFASILPTVSREIARVVIASAPPAELTAVRDAPKPPPLPAAAVALPPSIRPAAEPPPLPAVHAVQSSQEFAAEAVGQLVLTIGVWTAVLAASIGVALMLGQSFYLRQSGLSFPEIAKGAGGGLLAGLLGGVAGQMLYLMTSGEMIFDAAFRMFGWALLGSLIGIGMAFVVPNLRVGKGLMGGAVGGIIGAIGFLAAASALSGLASGDIASRLFGAALLGFCIGLMVAWAEQLFRQAWLEIWSGPEKRAVNLGAQAVSLGSDSRQCTVYAREAAPVAFRYSLQKGQVICEDVAGGRRREMRPGEEQQIGALTVKVCSGASVTAAPPPTLKVAPPPPPQKKVAAQAPSASPLPPVHPLRATERPSGATIKPPPPPPPVRPK